MDVFSVYELDNMMPQLDFDFGLRALGNDEDVMNLAQYIEEHKVLKVYTKHGKTNLFTFFMSPGLKPRVIIEEIPDEEEVPVAKPSVGLLLLNHILEQVPKKTNVNGGKQDKNEENPTDVEDNINVDGEKKDRNEKIPIAFEYVNPKDVDEGATTTCYEDNTIVEQWANTSKLLFIIENFDSFFREKPFVATNDEAWNKDSLGEDSEDERRKAYLKRLGKQKICFHMEVHAVTFQVGKKYKSNKKIKDKLNKVAIESRRKLCFKKNDRVRLRVVCRGNVLVKSNISELYFVNASVSKMRACTMKFVSTEILDQIDINLNGVSIHKVKRANEAATTHVTGDFTKQYEVLRDFLMEMQAINVGTSVKLEVVSEPKVLFVFSKPKHLQSADHICKPLQQKRWTKRLQSARRRLFVF
ncbi:hypothetical protein LXL04_021310 [Taraxacum kok-saghyz]